MDIKELLLQSQIGTVDGISLQDPKKLSQWLTIGENIYPRDTGSIFTGNVGSIDVIIKTDYDYHCLRYEYLVGLEVNKLESPNFIKTFALFLMTNPEKGYIPYLVLEKVRGIAFRDFKAKFDHLNNIALQLALALQHAQDLIDFTHYDLHLENVMYVALPQQTSLQYKIREKIYTIETDYILKIIDYGLSHVKLSVPKGLYCCVSDYRVIDTAVIPSVKDPLYDFIYFVIKVLQIRHGFLSISDLIDLLPKPLGAKMQQLLRTNRILINGVDQSWQPFNIYLGGQFYISQNFPCIDLVQYDQKAEKLVEERISSPWIWDQLLSSYKQYIVNQRVDQDLSVIYCDLR